MQAEHQGHHGFGGLHRKRAPHQLEHVSKEEPTVVNPFFF